MSVQRTSAARHRQQSPYARPQQKKQKSAWSWLSFLNPLRSYTEEQNPNDDPDDIENGDQDPPSRSPVEPVASRRSMPLGHDAPVHAQLGTASAPLLVEDEDPFGPPDPTKDLKKVSAFLEQRKNAPISAIEKEGLIALINRCTPIREPKRDFESYTPSVTSTPSRSRSPAVPFATPTAPHHSSRSASPKTLAKNPNGVYRWEGSGSARPRSKNRYQSPAFGSPRSTSDRLVLKTSPQKQEPPRSDTKRRRVGESSSSSSAVSSGAMQTPPRSTAPDPSPSHVPKFSFPSALPTPSATLSASQSTLAMNGTPPVKTNGFPQSVSTPRLVKPTAPAVPSPLRQAWGSSPPSTATNHTRQTQAANFMSELIKEVTPQPKPDVSNPYQTASPVKALPNRRPKRPRATGRPVPPDAKTKEAEKEKEKEEEFSAQSIIEATVPKGSKRSRPPSHMQSVRSPSPPVRQTSRRTTVEEFEEEDELDNDEEERTKKKVKPTANGDSASSLGINGNGKSDQKESKATPSVNGLAASSTNDFAPSTNGPTSSTSGSSSSTNGFTAPALRAAPSFSSSFKSSSAPKEPSKLRNVFQPPADSPPATNETAAQPSFASPPSLPVFSPFTPPASNATTAAAPPANTFHFGQPSSPKATFTPPKVNGSSPFTSTAPAASAMTFSPSFNFPAATSTSTAISKSAPASAAVTAPKATLPTFTFTVHTTPAPQVDEKILATAKNAAPSALPRFTFNSSTLKPTKSALAMPPPPVPAAATKGFVWPPPKPAEPAATSAPGPAWTCQECFLTNPGTAMEKCTICDAPRKETAASTRSDVKAFDWAAARATAGDAK